MTGFRGGEKNRASFRLERFEPVVLICYGLVAGLYLFLIPWTKNWQENIFFEWFGVVGGLALHPALRGGVSGIGLVLIFLGLAEFVRLFLGLIRGRGKGG